MSNYEIMLILDPKSDEKVASEIAKSTFKSKEFKVEKMERTELAYEINKSKTATYVLINANASGEEINEFTRKANISKNVWRILSINLDTEKGLNRKAKSKRERKLSFIKKNENKSKITSGSSNPVESKTKKTSSKSIDETKDKDTKTKKTTSTKSSQKEEVETKSKKTTTKKTKTKEDKE